MSTGLHPLSESYLNQSDLQYRKRLGQYFTPSPVRERLLRKLPLLRNPLILDPACGSGEFLLSAQIRFKAARLEGWEIDPRLVELTRLIAPSANVRETDALTQRHAERFDFVIGNPPYFEFQPEPTVRERYADVISGRSNIFAFFIKLGLCQLKSGGYLAYVIPPSMNNGAYFAALRKYVVNRANIEYLQLMDSPQLFNGALQSVMLMVLKKGKNQGDFIFERNGHLIFSSDAAQLERSFRNKTTLSELGLVVRTGQIVWNQRRTELTKNKSEGVLLVWSHNINPTGLALLNHASKPQYIKSKQYLTGPAVVVNRITGTASKATLKAALIPDRVKFLAENHVNVIQAEKPTNGSSKILKSICDQINQPDSSLVMRLVTGNTQVSRTELSDLLPIKKDF